MAEYIEKSSKLNHFSLDTFFCSLAFEMSRLSKNSKDAIERKLGRKKRSILYANFLPGFGRKLLNFRVSRDRRRNNKMDP